MQEGIRFGFITILIWLTILTGYLIYDKIYTGGVLTRTILVPPPQVEIIGEFDYE